MHCDSLHKTRSHNFISILEVAAEEGHFGDDAEHVYHQIDEIEHHLETNLLGVVLLDLGEHFLGGDHLLEEVVVSGDALIIEPLVAAEHGVVDELFHHLVHVVTVDDELVGDGQLAHYFEPVLCFLNQCFS